MESSLRQERARKEYFAKTWQDGSSQDALPRSVSAFIVSSNNVMPLDHQIAQKLRAVSGFNSRRAHDLIDLQLILLYDEAIVDFAAVKRICERIFRHSNTPPWPTPISKGESWDSLYTAQIADLPVLQTTDEAVDWVNKLIKRIAES